MRALLCAVGACVLLGCPAVDLAAQCRDGRLNGAETDCGSGVCALNRCEAPRCDDGVRNGMETGIDCGGPCAACQGGCVRNSDCGSGVCFDGACSAGPCAPPLLVCAQTCVDARVDPAHCGGCGMPCPAGEACVGAMCRPVCSGGTQQCGTVCVDVASDPNACGSCTRSCLPGQLCVGGDCFPRCGPGQTDCGGVCVSTDRDPLHCGGCSRPCPPGSGCLGGQCTPTCEAPLLACDSGACVDPRFDPLNCGGCGVACPPVQNALPACGIPGCTRSACMPGFADCDGMGGCEAELAVDELNCGVCMHVCNGPEQCLLGRCCGPLPMGSYQMTCMGCEACDGQLSCLCENAMQMLVPTSIPLQPCAGGFTNCNGVLQCNGC